jgi:hypothetical protein
LETSALISELSDSIQAEINDFLTNGVVTSSEVVGSILLSGDELLWVEKLSVGSSSDFINDSWLQVKEDASWHVLSSTGLREEGVEGIITTSDGLVRGHLAIRLDSVLKAEELPAGVAALHTGLTKMDDDDLAHCQEKKLL